MENLKNKSCTPCKKGTIPLKGEKLKEYFEKLKEGWIVQDEHHIEKEFKFKNFADALKFTNQIGQLAETEGHHPDIFLCWGRVKISLYTHKIDGLSDNDFIFAAKCDQLQH